MWRSSLQSAKTRLGADCGSDYELLIVKFRLKLKKVGKTTRPFSYDLNKIPYDYTVEVRNRFKGLDLIECLMNYGWRFVTLYRRQESRPSPRKRHKRCGFNSWVKKISWRRKWQPTRICLVDPTDRWAWQATVHGVTKSRTRLNDFTFTFFLS